MPASFFDSNVLIYTISSDERRRRLARALVDDGGTISVQVLNEVANVARRKLGLGWSDTRVLLGPFREALTICDLTAAIHDHGLRLGERYGFAIYDSMIVAAALAASCDTLWSEDMQNGLVVEDRLTIRNPFSEQHP